jgi:outer membrane cobalamin receptor
MNHDRILSAAVAPLLLLTSFTLAAAPPPFSGGASVDAADQGRAQTQPDGERPQPCMQTGTRLPPKGHCVNAAGQVVTREELEATGATTVGDALRRTVPSATIR